MLESTCELVFDNGEAARDAGAEASETRKRSGSLFTVQKTRQNQMQNTT
jgi:hypothetical protein